MTDTPEQIEQRINTALDLMPGAEGEAKLDAHCRWELEQVLRRIQLSDLTPSETMAVLSILAVVHSRVIGTHDFPGRRLRVVGGDTAADFG